VNAAKDGFVYAWYNEKDYRYNNVEFIDQNSGKMVSVHFGMMNSIEYAREIRANFDDLDFVKSDSKLVLFDIPEEYWNTDVDGTPYIYYGTVTKNGSVTTLYGGRVNQNAMARYGNMADMLNSYFSQTETN
jgi:hypothetical protein